MISKKEFFSLKAGDVVQFRSGLVRTIVSGPGDGKGKQAIVVPRHNRSWCHSITVVMFYNDAKHRLNGRITNTKKLALNHEVLRLKQIGFSNLGKAIADYAQEELRLCRVFGRPVCRRLARLTNTEATA